MSEQCIACRAIISLVSDYTALEMFRGTGRSGATLGSEASTAATLRVLTRAVEPRRSALRCFSRRFRINIVYAKCSFNVF